MKFLKLQDLIIAKVQPSEQFGKTKKNHILNSACQLTSKIITIKISHNKR